MSLLKRIAAKLPCQWQNELKRMHCAKHIRRGTFVTTEPEFAKLQSLIKPGDWVVDVGANVGHYTKRFSDLVGPEGRVIAFEPVPSTFALLAANVQLFSHSNVSLINAAASDRLSLTGMSIPNFSTGLANYYMASLSASEKSDLTVLAIPIDSLGFDRPITLVKIDAEGHEAFVLKGMHQLLVTYHPILIVETGSKELVEGLSALGYKPEVTKGSPNILFRV